MVISIGSQLAMYQITDRGWRRMTNRPVMIASGAEIAPSTETRA
jgi:hypothetical protein